MDLNVKIEEGDYSIGELIVPMKFKKCILVNNVLSWEEITVEGRKHSLKMIREKLFEKHKSLYRNIKTDEEVENMSRDEIIEYLDTINEYVEDDDDAEIELLKNKLKTFQRRRHLTMWHDGATVCNHSHILFMVSVIYDVMVFL